MPQIHCQKHLQSLGIRFQRLLLSAFSRITPVLYACYGPDEDTTNFVLFFVRCLGKAEVLMFTSTEFRAVYPYIGLSNFLLCAGLPRMVNQPLQTLMLDHSSALNPCLAISSLIQSVDIECNPLKKSFSC